MTSPAVIIRWLGYERDFTAVWRAMQQFTQYTHPTTASEIWLMTHSPVYTLGLAGKLEHVHDTGSIPIIRSDRGGQVTYHGPGQLIIYTLLNLAQLSLNIRQLVYHLEQSIIRLCHELHLHAHRRQHAPGVYIDHKKIASLGIKIRKKCCYHGLALNVKMDLTPFDAINPCGFSQLKMTQIADYHAEITVAQVAARIAPILSKQLNCVPYYARSSLPARS